MHRPLGETGIPGVAAVAHAGGVEQQPMHGLVQAFAREPLHCQLQPDESLAGVVDARARRDRRFEPLVGRILAPVRQAGGMAQHVAHGDACQPGRLSQVVRPGIRHQRRIQRQFAAIHQLQRHVGEHRLAQRGRLPHRLLADRHVPAGMRQAEATRPCQPAVLDHRDGDARHAQRLHLPRQVAQEIVGRDPVGIRVDGGRRAQAPRPQQGQREAGTEQAAAGHRGHGACPSGSGQRTGGLRHPRRAAAARRSSAAPHAGKTGCWAPAAGFQSRRRGAPAGSRRPG